MPLTRTELEHQIVTMKADGITIRELTRHFKIGRNTVRRILRRNDRQRDEGHEALVKKIPRKCQLDPYVPLVENLLKEFPELSGVRMLEKLQDAGYQGGITILRERLSGMRKRPKREPEVRFETPPAELGQMDWSPYTIPFKRAGKMTVLCFSYILAFSRRQYIDFTLHRDFHTLIRRHKDAFEYFGGVPKKCLYDGEKTVILRREAGRPVYNPAFVQFITHYRCKPLACRPFRPETKGKVEVPFKFVEGNLLNGRHFQDLEDLRACARWWLTEKSDKHLHDTTRRIVIELFMEQELSALTPLPLHPYDCSEVALCICRMDGFIEFETNSYSVPYEYVGDILTFKAAEHEVFIYSQDLDLIASHERLPMGACQKLENSAHRNHPKARYGLESVREAFSSLGDAAPLFLTGLKEKHPHNCGFHARHILMLKEKYVSDDINKALAHATRYQAFDAQAIERILAATAPQRTLESIRNDKARETLEAALPRIRQRNLREYDEMRRSNGCKPEDQESHEDAQALPDGEGS